MFTHVMVGTNDAAKARAFYDAAFGALGIAGMQTPNGALWYGDPESREGMFGVVTPRNDEPATFANGGTIGFPAKDLGPTSSMGVSTWLRKCSTALRYE